LATLRRDAAAFAARDSALQNDRLHVSTPDLSFRFISVPIGCRKRSSCLVWARTPRPTHNRPGNSSLIPFVIQCNALPAQVLSELKPAGDVPKVCFPELVARFETYFDAYVHNADIRRAIDDVMNRLDSIRTITTDSIPATSHPGHPKARPARLVKGQGPKENRVQYHCSHYAETGHARPRCPK
jgi:hypothetical protein